LIQKDLLFLDVKAGEDNPQAREEEGKLSYRETVFIKIGVQLIWLEFPECEDWNSIGKPPLSPPSTSLSAVLGMWKSAC